MAGNDNNGGELNSLLTWSIENSDISRATNPQQAPPAPSTRGLNVKTLNALFGGPSDAELMKKTMQLIVSPDASLPDKMTAFDNFEQLVESLDNANNINALGLWTPLLEQLDHAEPDMRRMAAWCVGTAVQNNIHSQEKLLAFGGVGKLAGLVVHEADQAVRKKYVYALSSSIRNHQPAVDEAVKHLPRDVVQADRVSADDVAKIDEMMRKLRG